MLSKLTDKFNKLMKNSSHQENKEKEIQCREITTQNLSKSCRICFEEDESQSNLVSPCKCKGSQEFVHLHCLRQWQGCVIKINNNSRAYVCSVCQTNFEYAPLQVPWYQHLGDFLDDWYQILLHPLFIISFFVPVLWTLQCITVYFITWAILRLVDFQTWIVNEHEEEYLEPEPTLDSGVLLVATENITEDSVFYHTVVLLIDHDEVYGSYGVILNKLYTTKAGSHFIVKEGIGGPVRNEENPIVLHNWRSIGSSERICSGIYLGMHLDHLLQTGHYLNDYKSIQVFHGYSGWSSVQLELEIRRKNWNVIDVSQENISVENVLSLGNDEMWNILRAATNE